MPPAKLEEAATIARTAHSSSGLGHRPLTAAARVRIPYAPFYRAWPREKPMVTRSGAPGGVGNARVVPTLVPTSEIAMSDNNGRVGRRPRPFPSPPVLERSTFTLRPVPAAG
jgi:hypothetical protein